MQIKDKIAHLRKSDPELFEALMDMVETEDAINSKLTALLKDLGNAGLYFGHSHNLPFVEVYHNVDQAVASGATLILAFNSDRQNIFGMHSTTVNNTRITFLEPGAYIIGANISWDLAAGGFRSINFLLNGNIYIGSITQFNAGAGSALVGVRQAPVTWRRCGRDDYVEVQVYQNSGAGVPIIIAPADPAVDPGLGRVLEFTPKFWAQMIVPDGNAPTPQFAKFMTDKLPVPFVRRFGE